MARTAGLASSLGKSLITIGAVGVTAMTALATKSPVLATTFAKMEVSMLKLSNTLGRQLKPVFESVNSLILHVNEALLDHGSTVSIVASGIGDSLGDIGSLITGQLSEIDNIIPKTGMAAVGAAAGFALLGPKGLFIGAALGLAAANIIETNKQKGLEESLLPGGIILDETDIGSRAKNIAGAEGFGGKIESAFKDSPVEFVYDAVLAIFSRFLKDEDVKNISFANANGVTRGI
ncbi:MAG: hypothetical protein ACTSO3_11745 [Candidatus Heimdallarchaeaceae archaeon]